MREKLKIRIKDDLADAETGKFMFRNGDIVECDTIITVKKSGEKNYVINGYVLPEDVVEVIENDR